VDDETACQTVDEDAMIDRALWDSAIELQGFLEACRYQFCFIGGIAYQRWGEPRVTDDMDVTVITGFGNETPVIQKVLKRYQARVSDASGFALQTRVLLIQDIAGFGIDMSLGALPFEERIVARSSLWGVQGIGHIRTCSAEDLVVLKAFAGRPQDWIDVEKVIIRQGQRLQRPLIIEELTPLAELKEEPEILEHLQSLLFKNQ
jgi:hypothetical protein